MRAAVVVVAVCLSAACGGPTYHGPANGTAECRDHHISYSRHRPGTCSGHGGVRAWNPASRVR